MQVSISSEAVFVCVFSLENQRLPSVRVAVQACFEFWYLLHFKYTTGHLKDYDAVADALRNYIPDYSKS